MTFPIKHYANLVFRVFIKNKDHFLLNLLGLTLGITCFLFALLYVFYETSYDDYHINQDRIARIVTTTESGGNETHTALSNSFLAPMLPKSHPEIELIQRFKAFDGKAAIKINGKSDAIAFDNVYYSDADVFNMFSYTLLEGDRNSCLAAPNSVVLSKRMARNLFGDSPAINRSVQVNDKVLKVTGVIADMRGNSDLRFDGLISMKTLSAPDEIPWMYTYVLFRSAQTMSRFQPKLDQFTRRFINPQTFRQGITISYRLEPLKSIHFSTSYVYDTPKGNKVSVGIFLALGILIFVIACANSINILVVRTSSRSLLITVQRVFGAQKGELVLLQAIESMIPAIIATILSFFIVGISLSAFAGMVNRPIVLSDLLNWRILLTVAAGLLVLCAGDAVYTRFYLQNIRMTDVLQSKNSRGFGMMVVPRIMLSSQFFISIGVTVAALLVLRQVNYLRDMPLGFNPRDVLVVELPIGQHMEARSKYLKAQLGSDANILKLSLCGGHSLPGEFTDIDVVEFRQQGVLVKRGIDNISVDANYFSLLQVPLVTGAGFAGEKNDSASKDQVIVTHLFARKAGWENPLGEVITESGDKEQVIGVVPDFHFSSLHNPVVPMIVFQDPSDPAYLLIRINSNKSGAVIDRLSRVWKTAFPQFPLSYFSLDQHLLEQYRDERNLFTLLASLSFLIIGISCIGLIAYTSYIVRVAIRDIAIRRIVGASFWDIFSLFNRRFLKLLGLAFLAACPLSWYLLKNWLAQFPYHTDLMLTDYLIAVGVMGVMVSLVILRYTWQCTRISPAKIIREQ